MNSLVQTSDFTLSQSALNDEDEELDQYLFLEDIYQQENRIQYLRALTGFSVEEFEQLWTVAKKGIPDNKRGKRSKITPRNAFYLTLTFF